MQDGSMTMTHQRATKISLTEIKKKRDQGTGMVIPQDQSCTGTEILGRDMAIETQKTVTGTGTRNPPRDQGETGREAITGEDKIDLTQKIGTGTDMRNPLKGQEATGRGAMTGEEKIDQRASGLGRTEILVAVTKEGLMKRKNDTVNRGDKTHFLSGHVLTLLF